MLACTKDCLSTVQTLVNSGASLSLRNKDGWNPFHIAAREGHAVIVSFLLESLPNSKHWDTTSKNGRTPLHTAALHGRADIVKILRDRLGWCVNVHIIMQCSAFYLRCTYTCEKYCRDVYASRASAVLPFTQSELSSHFITG